MSSKTQSEATRNEDEAVDRRKEIRSNFRELPAQIVSNNLEFLRTLNSSPNGPHESWEGEKYNQFQPLLSIQRGNHMKGVIVTSHYALVKVKRLRRGMNESTTVWRGEGRSGLSVDRGQDGREETYSDSEAGESRDGIRGVVTDGLSPLRPGLGLAFGPEGSAVVTDGFAPLSPGLRFRLTLLPWTGKALNLIGSSALVGVIISDVGTPFNSSLGFRGWLVLGSRESRDGVGGGGSTCRSSSHRCSCSIRPRSRVRAQASGNSQFTFKVLEVTESGWKCAEVHFQKLSVHFVEVEGS